MTPLTARTSCASGLHNKLQTKREGQLVNLVDWDLYTDWRLQPNPGQTTFADLYSDLTVRPRSWLTLGSETRYNIHDGLFRHVPNDGHSQSPADPGVGPSVIFICGTIWDVAHGLWHGQQPLQQFDPLSPRRELAFRAVHWFEARTGTLQEQDYSVYRDMRSWTAGLHLMVRNSEGRPQDITFAFTFWLKTYPRTNPAL